MASSPPADANDQPPAPPKEPRCTDIFSEKWVPEFKSTYPLSKALGESSFCFSPTSVKPIKMESFGSRPVFRAVCKRPFTPFPCPADLFSSIDRSANSERRKVLVEYIQLVKRCRARVDKVESPPKRNVVTQPQTMEELEREVEKCDQELEQVEKKREENANLRKDLTNRYKALYRQVPSTYDFYLFAPCV